MGHRPAWPLEASPLTEAQVATLLRATTTPQVLGLAGEDADLRISIAGAQEKTALLQMDGSGTCRTAQRPPRTSSSCRSA